MKLNDYYTQISNIPLLSNEEEIELLSEYAKTQSTSAKEKLVKHNLRLVVAIANKYHVAYATPLDLVQEGNIGLIRAVQKFDLGENVKFSTYAGYWIRAGILRFIMNNAHLVKIGTTQDQRKMFFNMAKLRAKLAAQGIEPTIEVLAKELGVNNKSVQEMNIRTGTYAIGDEDNAENFFLQRNLIRDQEDKLPDNMLENYELQTRIRALVNSFYDSLSKEDQRIVFAGRFLEEDTLSFEELGAKCGFTRQRAQQIEAQLKPKLKKFLIRNGISV